MERKIGEVFTCKKIKFQVVKSELIGRRCKNECSLHGFACWDVERVTGACSSETRKDGNDVIFKQITDEKNTK